MPSSTGRKLTALLRRTVDGLISSKLRRPRRGFRRDSNRPLEVLEARQLLSGTPVAAVPGNTGATDSSGSSPLSSLDYRQFATLTPFEIRQLTADQIASIPDRSAFRSVPARLRRALIAEQIQALNVRQTGLSGLTASQIEQLSPQQIRRLRPRDVPSLRPEQIGFLRITQTGSLCSSDEFARLPEELRHALSRRQVRALDPSRTSIRLLSDDQREWLTKSQRAAVPAEDRPYLYREQNIELEYLGHISVPDIPFDPARYEAGRHFGYSTGAFTYIPERNSFLLSGHVYGQLVAEISNPGPGGTATLLHDFVDVTQGALQQQSDQSPHAVQIQSLHYQDGRVLVSVEQFYNVQGNQLLTHGSFAPDLDAPDFQGWWGIGNWTGQSTGFYMTTLPDEYAPAGNRLLTGGSVSWRVGSSSGPAAILIDPNEAVPGTRPDALTLLHYAHDGVPREIDLSNPQDRGRSAWTGGVEDWLGNNNIGGVAVIGDRLVYFGRQGLGYDFYGTPDDYQQLTGLSDVYGGKGYHSGPYSAALWIYSLPGLLNGDRSVQRIEFPWALSPQADLRNAVVVGNTLYVVEASARNYGLEPVPVIHVLKIHQSIGISSQKPFSSSISLPDPLQ